MVAKLLNRRRWVQAGLLALCAATRTVQAAPAETCGKDTDCPGSAVCRAGRCGSEGAQAPGSEPGSADGSGTPAAASKVAITDRAREQFEIGVRLLEDPSGGRIAEAYDAFKAAYADSPSPKILGNLGLCAMMLERDGEAIDAYERYQVEVTDAQPAERSRIENDLVILRGRVATVELAVKPPTGVLVDERVPPAGPTVVNRYSIGASPLTMRVRAGKHRLRVELAGHDSAAVELELRAGTRESRTLQLERKGSTSAPTPGSSSGTASTAGPRTTAAPPPANDAMKRAPEGDPGGSLPTSGWAMLAVTCAVGAGAIITGALALDRKSTYDEFSSGGSRKEAEAWRAEGEALNITTDVLLATTAAGAVVTLVLFLVDSDDDEGGAPQTGVEASGRGTPPLAVVPWLGPQGPGGGLSVGF